MLTDFRNPFLGKNTPAKHLNSKEKTQKGGVNYDVNSGADYGLDSGLDCGVNSGVKSEVNSRVKLSVDSKWILGCILG